MSVIDEVAEHLEAMGFDFIRDESTTADWWGLSWRSGNRWCHMREDADHAELWAQDVSARQVTALIDYGYSGDRLKVEG